MFVTGTGTDLTHADGAQNRNRPETAADASILRENQNLDAAVSTNCTDQEGVACSHSRRVRSTLP